MTTKITPCDEEIVKSAQQGMSDAMTLLYERYLPIVFSRVRCLIPSEDVEDITQEVFIAVIRSLKSFRGDAKFGTWLRTLTNRQIADYYRRRKPQNVLIDERIKATSKSVSTDEAIVLRQALCKLQEKHREIVLLRFVEDMPFKEIAQLHGRSLEATKSLYRRAMSTLQKYLEEING